MVNHDMCCGCGPVFPGHANVCIFLFFGHSRTHDEHWQNWQGGRPCGKNLQGPGDLTLMRKSMLCRSQTLMVSNAPASFQPAHTSYWVCLQPSWVLPTHKLQKLATQTRKQCKTTHRPQLDMQKRHVQTSALSSTLWAWFTRLLCLTASAL